MKEMEWGIIGPGQIAHKFIEDLGRIDPPQRVKVIMGHTPDKTEAFARQYGITACYDDIDQFIREGRPEVVYIATPHTLHFEQAKACLENGIPVLCEKPLTVNAKQCRELIRLSEKHHTFLMEGMWIRFLPGIRCVLEILSEGTIGKIISIKASIGFKAPHTDNRFFDPELGGGSLLDLGIYPVFLATLCMGRPVAIKAIAKLTDEGIDEAASVLFSYEDGAYASLESSLVGEPDSPAEIAGERGVIRILHPWFEKSPGIELHLFREEKDITYPNHWEGHGFQFEAEEVVTRIEEGETASSVLPLALTLETLEIMDEIRRQVHVSYETK